MFQTRFSKSKRVLPVLGVTAVAALGYSAGISPAKLGPQTASPANPSPIRLVSDEHAVGKAKTSIYQRMAAARLDPVPGARAGTFEEMSRVMTRTQWNAMSKEQHVMARGMLLLARKKGEVLDYCFRQGTPVAQMRAFESLNQALTKAAGAKTNFQPYFGRWSATATNPTVARNQPLTLTWNLTPDNANSNIEAWAVKTYGSTEAFRVRMRAMFALWTTHTNITYKEVDYDDGADANGALGLRPDIRISGAALTGGAVGVNSNPNFGDMTLKTDDDFFAPANDPRGERLFNTTTHEHGHGIGLSHSCPQDGTKVMEPAVNEGFHGAQFDDILSAQFLYGDQYEKGSRNNTPATGSDIGTTKIGDTVTISDVSLNINDVDFYKITPDSEERSVTAVLKPAGRTYLEGAQNADASCSAGTPFDPTIIRDLNLEIVNSAGTVLASSAASPAGGTETITSFDLTGAGPYYAKVSTPDTGDKIQAYTLALTIGPRTNRPPSISNLRFTPKRPNTNSTLKLDYDLTDADGDVVTATTVWKKNGTVISVTDDTIDLSQDGAGDDGDIFEVTVNAKDTAGSTSSQTIKVTIRPANVRPVFPDATFSTKENKVLNAKLKATDANSADKNAEEILTFKALRKPTNGTLVLSTDGTFIYTPKVNYNGTDSFTARVSDQEGLSDEATISLNITPVNNKPVLQDDVIKTSEDVVLTIDAADLLKNDTNGEIKGEEDPIRITAIKASSNFPGKLVLDTAAQTITFTPKANWFGETTFTYTVTDSAKLTATAKVTLSVASVNDAPTAQDLNLNTIANTTAEIELIGADVEGVVSSFSIKVKPLHGKASIFTRDGKWYLQYKPTKDYIGADSIQYISRDGYLSSEPAIIVIDVAKNNSPKLVSLAPKSGTFTEGNTVIFTQKVRDADGIKHLDAVSLLISNSALKTDDKNGAALWYDVVNNVFTLSTDDGSSTYTPMAVGKTLYNSQVSVTLGKEDISRASDGTLTLKWHVTFKTGFTGTKTLWSFVEDLGGATAGYTAQGSIVINPLVKGSTKATSSNDS